MRRILPFDEAVKAAKFLVFASVAETSGSEDSSRATAGQFYLLQMYLDASFLAPEWRYERGAKLLEDISFYEGDKLVYTGQARAFCASQYYKDYRHRLEDVWGVGRLMNEMVDAMIGLLQTHYRGDFSDTVVYEIWKKHTPGSQLSTKK